MGLKPLFLIVDDANPSDQAEQLRQSLKIANLGGSVDFASSPAQMLAKIEHTVPDLILLDHHWVEADIAEVLAQVRRIAADTRVVLFTGKTLEPNTIIQCARWGVVEYLVKGASSGDIMAKKLSLLIGSPDNTIGRLSAPSGAVQQLIQEAEKAVKDLRVCQEKRGQLDKKIDSLKSIERQRILNQLVRFMIGVVYLGLGALLIWFGRSLGGGIWTAIFCVLVALGGLFALDKSISSFNVTIGKSQVAMSRHEER